jgi:hypothetical protein
MLVQYLHCTNLGYFLSVFVFTVAVVAQCQHCVAVAYAENRTLLSWCYYLVQPLRCECTSTDLQQHLISASTQHCTYQWNVAIGFILSSYI